MKKNTIRLTESELITLVRRIVNENMEAGNPEIDAELEEGLFGDKMKSKFSWVMDAAKKVADLFKNDYMDKIPEEDLEQLKGEAKDLAPSKMGRR